MVSSLKNGNWLTSRLGHAIGSSSTSHCKPSLIIDPFPDPLHCKPSPIIDPFLTCYNIAYTCFMVAILIGKNLLCPMAKMLKGLCFTKMRETSELILH